MDQRKVYEMLEDYGSDYVCSRSRFADRNMTAVTSFVVYQRYYVTTVFLRIAKASVHHSKVQVSTQDAPCPHSHTLLFFDVDASGFHRAALST